MKLERLLQTANTNLNVLLRSSAYGRAQTVELVRDVMGLANLPGDEPRYLVFGVVRKDADTLTVTPLAEHELEALETYRDVLHEYVEPALRVSVRCGSVAGKLIGVLEIINCDNPPYIVATDVGAGMQRGACWIRGAGGFRPAGRSDIDRMYAERSTKGQEQGEAETAGPLLQLGFGDDPLQATWCVPVPDCSAPPSQVAARQLQNQIEAAKAVEAINPIDSSVARLVHIQQYGNDQRYDKRGVNTMVENYNSIAAEFSEADHYYFAETQAVKLNLSLQNCGSRPLESVEVVLSFPRAAGFEIHDQICPPPGEQRSALESELFGYPEVQQYNQSVQVRQKLDGIEPEAARAVFDNALRMSVDAEFAGKQVPVKYTIHAAKLDEPVSGILQLAFE